MVDIHVGEAPNAKHFRIHKAILCQKVPFFDTMFNGGFKEATENKANLPSDRWETFDVLQEWVYTGTLRKLSVKTNSETKLLNYSIINAYMLFDKFCLPHLADMIVSMYITMSVTSDVLPRVTDIATAYTVLPPASKFRQYFLMVLHFINAGLSRCAHHLNVWSEEKLSQLLVQHPTLCLDYMKLTRHHSIGKAAEDPRKMSHCLFHQHGEGEECTVKKDT
ncbi:hypothetical protein BKA65DRAFT_398386 [Rhexocercosporidium sp. MPI-PUGE-AT-0058]|nr:hypothetical protein BKA65DRAFT_398386 [Rhexocercosporidium sp. MPI-PUGE-AT-0058]